MKTLDYILSQQQAAGGFAGWEGSGPYPECTGYLIPTLLDYGQTEAAQRAADYLVAVQNDDGSFNGMDGKPYVFDTGACFEGLRAAGRQAAAEKALRWLEAQPDTGELYLVRVKGLTGRDCVDPKPNKNTRTHYWAYCLEGLYLLGHVDFVRAQLGKLPAGQQPYYVDGADTDTCATAQVAKLKMLCGMSADAEMAVLHSLVNADGSLPHDALNRKKPIWACKYFLDALKLETGGDEWWRVKEWQFRNYSIDIVPKPLPFGISGMFRVRNDWEFLYDAVASHLPWLDEAVIILQPSDQRTTDVVLKLLHDFPDKVRVERYPVSPVFIDSKEWETVPVNSMRSFVYLSNWGLAQCRYSWLARMEADVICLPTFGKIADAIRTEPDKKIVYGRVLLNVAGKDCDQISATNPRNGGGDEFVAPNDPAGHFVKRPRYEVYESPWESKCGGWSGLHMKRCKERYLPVWNNERYVPYDRDSVRGALEAFNQNHPYPADDAPEGAEVLFEDMYRRREPLG
jgi:hypothetical protein